MMSVKRVVNIAELQQFGDITTFNGQLLALIEQQKATWEIMEANLEALSTTQNKVFVFGNFKIIIQHNPERIRSSAAKTDKESIKGRKCFLCLPHLPVQQRGILVHNDFLALCNPYPIFNHHFTLSKTEHSPQLIKSNFEDMLHISQKLSGFTTFYNGPQCGASAPDHMHFQACTKGVMPVEKEYENIKNNFSYTLVRNKWIRVFTAKGYLRKLIAMESANHHSLLEYFEYIYRLLPILQGEDEPRLNILCNYNGEQWQVVIFPRSKQKPSQFFEEGKRQIIIGPASVELGGIFVLPRKEDFEKITEGDIKDILSQVTIGENEFENVVLYL